jgi:hypothetical protein
MPVTQTRVGELAKARGVVLAPGERLPWLTNRGHLAVGLRDRVPQETLEVLRAIFIELGGDEVALAAKRAGSDPRPDFMLDGQLVEIDEHQHFTTERRRTLEAYPATALLGFDRREYIDLCRAWHSSADRYRASKQTAEFSFPGGRRAQRAYFDVVRDLLAPHCSPGPAIRIPAPGRDPEEGIRRLEAVVGIVR